MMDMYQHKQYKKRTYNHSNQPNSYLGQISLRRLIIYILLLYILIHLIQTGRFLMDHFFESEDVSDVVRFEMDIWRENEISQTKIPRYIHQIWISSIDDKQMPEHFQKAANSCIKLNINYNYTLWTHKKLVHWLNTTYSWFLPIYISYRYDMQRIDAMKYLLLFHYGGIYLDLDVQCHVQDIISSMIVNNHTESEPDIIFHMGEEGISANTDVLASKKFHPFFKLAINRLKSANRWFYIYHLTIILSAGPTYLYGIYRKFPLKDNFYFVSNDLLWGKLLSGVGGETWYGRDTLLLKFLIQHKFVSSCFLVIVIIIILFILKCFKRKRY